MAAATAMPVVEESRGDVAPVLKPLSFKASELPLSSAVRSAIETLAHGFKKKGGYDEIRKQVWDKFEASVCLSFATCRLSTGISQAKLRCC